MRHKKLLFLFLTVLFLLVPNCKKNPETEFGKSCETAYKYWEKNDFKNYRKTLGKFLRKYPNYEKASEIMERIAENYLEEAKSTENYDYAREGLRDFISKYSFYDSIAGVAMYYLGKSYTDEFENAPFGEYIKARHKANEVWGDLILKYPQNRYADNAAHSIISWKSIELDSYSTKEDIKDVIMVYETFLKDFPESEWYVETLYGTGELYLRLNNKIKAKEFFLKCIQENYDRKEYRVFGFEEMKKAAGWIYAINKNLAYKSKREFVKIINLQIVPDSINYVCKGKLVNESPFRICDIKITVMPKDAYDNSLKFLQKKIDFVAAGSYRNFEIIEEKFRERGTISKTDYRLEYCFIP